MIMAKKTTLLVAVIVLGALVAAGCGTSSVQTKASQQIAAAKASLASAKAKGVQVPGSEQNKIPEAEKALKTDSVQALILATEAKAEIVMDISDAFGLAEQTYNVSRGAAETAISKAPASTNLTQANQSIATADARKAAAKTVGDWYNSSDGPIFWANLAAQQATTAALAQAASSAAAQAQAAVVQRVDEGAELMTTLMTNYLVSTGANPADYKIGIQKYNEDATWASGTAAQVVAAPGSKEVSFLFQFENAAWVLRAAPSWTTGQFGSPTDLVP
jgi:hypothetical protein